MKTAFISMILLATLAFNSKAQEISKREKRGDKYAFSYSYDKAIKQYNKADELTMNGQRNLAKSYSETHQHALSASTYETIVSNQGSVNNEDYYNYAMVLKSTGNYTEAAKWMDKFQQAAPDDLRSKSYAAYKSELVAMQLHNDKNKIERLEFNSEAQEFAPDYYQQSLVYSSSQPRSGFIKRSNNQNGQPYLQIYTAEVSDGQLQKEKQLAKKLNTRYHDGPASFSNDQTYMAFTRNTERDRTKDKVVELQIWFSTFVDGKWSKEEPFAFNNPEYSVGHPYLTESGNTMYFVSDMPGGFGKADIYKTEKNESGAWTKPENLGNKINTEGNELFPYLEESDEILMFTSDGHYGLGGMDVFMVPMNGDEFGNVVNAGAPVNTMHDDFALIIDQESTKGYLSSNRNSANDDIYSGNFTEGFNVGNRLEGIAVDKDGNLLPGTLITLKDDKGEIIDTVTTATEGEFTFLVDSDKYYTLVGTKDDYQEGSNTANTLGDEYIVSANVTLADEEKEVVEVAEVVDGPAVVDVNFGKAIELKPIYFDQNRYTIRPDAAKGLDEIVKIMNANPQMVVKLKAHCDSRDTKGYNQVLSEKRASASLAYIKKRITYPDRISGAGYGETLLVNECAGEGDMISDCSDDEHQKNRRTEFVVVSN